MDDVTICNIGLDNIGARFSITSLAPPLPAPNAIVVARQYQMRIDSLHRAAHWNFARKTVAGQVLKAAQGTPENPNGTTLPIPPFPWQYEYAYPPDCLLARYLLCNPPQSGASNPFPAGVQTTPVWPWGNPGYKFVVANDTDANGNQIKCILTDLEFAQIVYTCRVTDVDLWDSLFQTAASSYIGSWLVNPLARNAQVLKEQIDITTGVVQAARVSDGNEGITSTDRTPDWLAVRGLTSYGMWDNALTYYGWQSLGFPSGFAI
jgi:hypothetical protein